MIFKFLLKWIKFSLKKTRHTKKNWKMGAGDTGNVLQFCQSGEVGTVCSHYVLQNREYMG